MIKVIGRIMFAFQGALCVGIAAIVPSWFIGFMTIVFFARGEFFNEDSWSWFVLGFVLSLTVFCSAGFIGFWQLAGWAQERDEMHNDPSQRK